MSLTIIVVVIRDTVLLCLPGVSQFTLIISPTSRVMRFPTYSVKSRSCWHRQRLRVIRADRRRTGLLRDKAQSNVRKQPTRRTRRSPIPDQMLGFYKKSLSDEKFKPSEPPDSSTHPDHSVDNGNDPDSPQGHHDLPQPPPADSTNLGGIGGIAVGRDDRKAKTELNAAVFSDTFGFQSFNTSGRIRGRSSSSVRPPTPSQSAAQVLNLQTCPVPFIACDQSNTSNGLSRFDRWYLAISIKPGCDEPSKFNNDSCSCAICGARDLSRPEGDSDSGSEASDAAVADGEGGRTESEDQRQHRCQNSLPSFIGIHLKISLSCPSKARKDQTRSHPWKGRPRGLSSSRRVDAAADEEECDAELEADMQPAHRAEALDVLATIELKFALLREKLYVEKMEALAWEEALVANGTCSQPIVCARFYASFY